MKPNCPIHFHGIDHVVLQVTDRERTLRFYIDILGLAIERVIEDRQIYQVRCGRNLIDLIVLPAGKRLADKDERGLGHLCLLVRGDVEEMVDYFKEHAVPITFGPIELYGATGFGTSIYVLDPDGHTIEIKADCSQYAIRTTSTELRAGLTRPKPEPASPTATAPPAGMPPPADRR
jgi:catechol 2,3-dioxygenase-like lactoylglutathione lyase family enzyme